MSYQYNYAASRPQMYDKKSREIKARRMVKTLSDYFGKRSLKKLSVLDVGCSTGIIDNILAKSFKKVVGTDIDTGAIEFANKKYKGKNLIFKFEDAMRFSFKDNSFDIVICTHVYEHVPNSKKLFLEIYRILKPGGVCYLAAINKYWVMEPHYDLPFLSWIPKKLANYYVKSFKKSDKYYESPKSYWELSRLTNKFKRTEYTQKILKNPQKFGYEDAIKPKSAVSFIAYILSPMSKYFSPTFFWLLEK